MKIKTSITLSEGLVKAIRPYAKSYRNRSEFIEAALWTYVRQHVRQAQNARDLEIINRRADALNTEAIDVLDYQAEAIP
jgi:metal-responsive CopG/Arc/MetJ family transcriptional regulator